ncbi:HEAT repeat domain-containing protein [Candidatus Woesearchaeota archaeon]|nr:HEAT repeat domain-containing protein [Candidatus Woesearchaeota archaeon]
MNIKKIVLITVFFLIILQLAMGDNGQEVKTLNSTESKDLGSEITGTVQDGTYYITSGVITGDLTGKKVVIKGDAKVTLGPEMKGTLTLDGGTVILLPPLDRAVKGYGTCSKNSCTITNGETGSGIGKISQGNFLLESDGTLHLESGIIGEDDSKFNAFKLKNIKFVNGKWSGSLEAGSEIDLQAGGSEFPSATAFGNKADFEYDPISRKLKLIRPKDKSEEYKIKITKLGESLELEGAEIVFEDKETPTKELITGSVKKVSNTHLIYSKNSKFINEHSVRFEVKNGLNYATGPKPPTGVSYVQSDVDAKAGVYLLRVYGSENDIKITLPQEHPYKWMDIDSENSNIVVTKGNAVVKINDQNKLATNRLNLLNMVFSVHSEYKTWYISKDGASRFDNEKVEKIINSMKTAQEKSFLEHAPELTYAEAIQWAESKDKYRKEAGIKALGEVGDTRAIDTLKKYTKDFLLGEEAISALGKIDDPRSTDALLELLDPKQFTIFKIYEALGNQKSEKATNALLEAIRKDKGEYREQAANALAKHENAVPSLIKILEEEKDKELIETAANVLGKIGTHESIDSLFAIVEKKMKSPSDFLERSEYVDNPQFKIDSIIIVASIKGLGHIKENEVSKKLIELYNSPDSSFYGQEAIVQVLRHRRDNPEVNEFVKNGILEGKTGFYSHEFKYDTDKDIVTKLYQERLSDISKEFNKDEFKRLLETLDKNQNEKITVKDAYFLETLKPEDLEESKEDLKKEISQRMQSVGHTRRSESDSLDASYETEDFDAQSHRISFVEMKKIKAVLDTMQNKEVRDRIGQLIQTDLSERTKVNGIKKDGKAGEFEFNGKKSEIGGLCFVNKQGTIDFVPCEPDSQKDNGQYSYAMKVSSLGGAAFSDFHFHATRIDDSRYAGPSGSILGGDIGRVVNLNKDGIVITSVGQGRFNIDYYTELKVIDLGTYEYKTPTPSD